MIILLSCCNLDKSGEKIKNNNFILQSIIAVAMVLSGTIDSLIDFFSFTAWIFYGGAMLALIVMRFTKPNHPRPYKVCNWALFNRDIFSYMGFFINWTKLIQNIKYSFLFQVPIIIPVVVLVISLYLIVAPIIDVPQIEYLYAALFMVGGLVFYFPLVYYGYHSRIMGKYHFIVHISNMPMWNFTNFFVLFCNCR